MAAASFLASSAYAGENPWRAAVALAPTTEVWSGGSTAGTMRSLYSGISYAPGTLLEETGWRFRLVAGTSTYDYEKFETPFRGITAFVDVLVGYQWRADNVTAKVFAGISATGVTTTPYDPEVADLDGDIGAKLAAEFWIDVAASTFAQIDTSFASTGPMAAAHGRLGYRISSNVSIGPELRLLRFDDARHEAGLGSFVRYAWPTGELTVSGGWTRESGSGGEPYAMINLLTRR